MAEKGSSVRNDYSEGDSSRLKEVERNLALAKLEHEFMDSQIRSLEDNVKDITTLSTEVHGEFLQSQQELYEVSKDTRSLKLELTLLRDSLSAGVNQLEARVNSLLQEEDAAGERRENMANNVQLVLDHYLNTKFGVSDEGAAAGEANYDEADDEEEEEEEVEEDRMEEDPRNGSQEEDDEGDYSIVSMSQSRPASQTPSLMPHQEPVQLTEEDLDKIPYGRHPQVSFDERGNLKYSLAKDITTVQSIWQEYSRGIHGGPPIKYLNEMYQTRWKLRNENSTFLRRKKIYKAVEYAVENLKYDEDEAVDELERHRYDEVEQKKRAMYWLYDNIPYKFRPNA